MPVCIQAMDQQDNLTKFVLRDLKMFILESNGSVSPGAVDIPPHVVDACHFLPEYIADNVCMNRLHLEDGMYLHPYRCSLGCIGNHTRSGTELLGIVDDFHGAGHKHPCMPDCSTTFNIKSTLDAGSHCEGVCVRQSVYHPD